MSKKIIPDVMQVMPPEVAMLGRSAAYNWAKSIEASPQNFGSFSDWWELFYNAAISRFKWRGLPSGMDERFIEVSLFNRGNFAVTQIGIDSHIFFMGSLAAQDNTDEFLNPRKIIILGANGERQENRHASNWYDNKGQYHMPDSAVCYDTLSRLPLFRYFKRLCSRLAMIDNVVDQHIRAQRAPYIFTVPEEGRKNAEEFFNKLDSGQPAFYVNPSSVAGLIQPQILSATNGNNYVGDKLLNDQLKLIAQGYTRLGIDNNASAEKKERVQTAETLANDEQIQMQRAVALAARQEFCKTINYLYNLDVSVSWRIPHVSEDSLVGDDDVL